jgi:ABC-type branched-subunit amino acid transport system substrate-binding protein
VNTTLGSFPENFSGVEAAARSVNAEGGVVDGSGVHHMIVVKTCNTQLTAPGEAACARQAVSDHAVAEVGAFVAINPVAFENTLLAGHTADLADFASNPAQYAVANTFPIMFGINQGICASKPFLTYVHTGTKVALVAQDTPGAQPIADGVEKILKSEGYTVTRINPAPTTTDYSPIVQQIASSGAQTVIFAGAQAMDAAVMLGANALGHQWTYCVGDGVWSNAQLTKLGAVASHFYAGTWWPEKGTASKYPLVHQFVSDIDAQHAAGDSAAVWTTGYSNKMNGWLGMYIFKQVVGTMKGTIDNASFFDALKTAKVSFGGVMTPIAFSVPRGAGEYPRVFNPNVILIKWNPSLNDYDTLPVGVNVIKLLYGP